MSDTDRQCFLLSDDTIVCQSAKTLYQMLCRRRLFLYSGMYVCFVEPPSNEEHTIIHYYLYEMEPPYVRLYTIHESELYRYSIIVYSIYLMP